jgi:glycosyltransferase involved in cell wall biosynthesis
MPKISIIIPAYNSSLFLKRTVESVLAQTFTDWELLIIDDCSTDNTRELAAEFTKQDARIKLYQTLRNSGGPAAPKNLGFKMSQGELIAYLDHDDEWLPAKLTTQIDLFANSPKKNLGLVSCGVDLIDDSGKCFGVFIPLKKENPFPEILLRNPIHSNSSVLLKREVIEAVGGRDEAMKYSEDWDMWIRVAKAGYVIDHIYKPLVRYHFHKENATKTLGYLSKIADVEYVFKKQKDLYKKYNYVHVGFFRLGVMYFLGDDPQKSRQCFTESLKINKWFLPSYFGYLFSWLGAAGKIIINSLIFLGRLFHGKKYLLSSR